MLSRTMLLSMALVAGCFQVPPPAPAPLRAPTTVNASFGKSWDAVIDAFAVYNVPIRSMERLSGFITSDQQLVPLGAAGYADCGAVGLERLRPTDVVYNVVVRGDSTASTVRVSALWRTVLPDKPSWECVSRGDWENGFELRVKAIAEGAGERTKSS